MRRWGWRLFLTVLLPLAVAGMLGRGVWGGGHASFDEPLLRWCHVHATPALDRCALALTHLGRPGAIVFYEAAILTLLLARRQWRMALFLVTTGAGAVLLTYGGKLAFSRARPQLWEPLVPEASFSFPSGHTIGSTAFAVAMMLLAWHTRWRWPVAVTAGAFALIIGLTRIYLGVHFPSDVLAGWCAAVAWVAGVFLLWTEGAFAGIMRTFRARRRPASQA